MRKNNKMALRVLSTSTFLAMVASCTASAFAGTYYLENGDITVDAKEDGNHITQGDLYQDHLDEGKTIITNHEDESDTSAVSNTVTIKVDEGVTGDVTIKDANIDNSCGRYDTEKNGITVDTKGESSKANITLDNVTIKPGEDGDGVKTPAVQSAKTLPQAGSNWLAVLGTALSGAFLMAAGFFLDRKRGENR